MNNPIHYEEKDITVIEGELAEAVYLQEGLSELYDDLIRDGEDTSDIELRQKDNNAKIALLEDQLVDAMSVTQEF